MTDKKNLGVIIYGEQIDDRSRKATRIDGNGVHEGVVTRYIKGEVPADNCTEIKTEPLVDGSNVHTIVEENPIGKPSMVNSKTYKDNWETIFGTKQTAGEC